MELEEPLTFQKLGGPNKEKQFDFLYQLPEDQTTWWIGTGKSASHKIGSFHAPGGAEPPATGWISMGNNTKGSWKLTKQQASLASTLEQAEAEKGSATLDGGVLCLLAHKTWIILAANDSRLCDENVDCEGGWDIPDKSCLGKDFRGTKALLIEGGEGKPRGVYDLVKNNDSRPLFYKRVDG